MPQTAQTRFPPDEQRPDVILSSVWAHLAEGARSAAAAWHLGCLATVDQHGAPAARTVVLRHVEETQRRLIFHTDRRSPKLDHLRCQPRVAWLFYDPVERIQVRLTGQVTVHLDDALADERWRASSIDSRRCYLAPWPPGTVLAAPTVNLPESLWERPPTLAESEAGRGEFAAVVTEVDAIDWYALHASGHVRLGFQWTGTSWHAAWQAS